MITFWNIKQFVMKKLRTLASLMTLTLALPLSAQDFGYAKDKAFYKAHWGEIVKELEETHIMENAQYILYDFDNDKSAELYLWFEMGDEVFYSIKDNQLTRLSAKDPQLYEQMNLDYFTPHYMAPCQLLLDKPLNPQLNTEQHIYDRFELPHIWFKLHPKVEGKFNIKTAIDAIRSFDCDVVEEALYSLVSGAYEKERIKEFVVDPANGYACIRYNTPTMNMLECCYWNMDNGQKLFALHYHVSDRLNGEVVWLEQTMFMTYDPKTQYMTPVVAPIEGFDFRFDCNFSLPRRGKNISLSGPEEAELQWNGKGFTFHFIG